MKNKGEQGVWAVVCPLWRSTVAYMDKILKRPGVSLSHSLSFSVSLHFSSSLIPLCWLNLPPSIFHSPSVLIFHYHWHHPFHCTLYTIPPYLQHIHTHTYSQCLHPCRLCLSSNLSHLKLWLLMDWKSWRRGNSHLKINVSLSILKGSQPSLCVCVYVCVSSRGRAHVISTEMPSSLLVIRQRLKEGGSKRGLADWPIQAHITACHFFLSIHYYRVIKPSTFINYHISLLHTYQKFLIRFIIIINVIEPLSCRRYVLQTFIKMKFTSEILWICSVCHTYFFFEEMILTVSWHYKPEKGRETDRFQHKKKRWSGNVGVSHG